MERKIKAKSAWLASLSLLVSICFLAGATHVRAQPSPEIGSGISVRLKASERLRDPRRARVLVLKASMDSALIQVMNEHGVSIEGLDTSNFQVSSMKRGHASITRVDTIRSSCGVALTFVLDNSTSMFHSYDSLTKYLDGFVEGAKSDNGWSLPTLYSAIVFDNLPRTPRHLTTHKHDVYLAPQGYTTDIRKLENFWHFYDSIRSNWTPLYDAIQEGLDPSETLSTALDTGYRHIIIVVSDGDDNASRITLDQLSDLLSGREIRLFALNYRSEEDGRLDWLTRHHHGACLYANSLSELKSSLESLQSTLFLRYAIHYKFPPLGAGSAH